MTEQEMFIEALTLQFMEPAFQFPDIGRRVAELAIKNNDMTWRIWQAARATPTDQEPVAWITKEQLSQLTDLTADAWVYWRESGHVAEGDEIALCAAPPVRKLP